MPIEAKRLIRALQQDGKSVDIIFPLVVKTFGEGVISKDHLSRLYNILTRGSTEQIEKSFLWRAGS